MYVKRCQYRLPGMHYNCRAVGKYTLEDRVYCAHHHSIQFRVLNPQYGQQHDWHNHVNRFTGEVDKYESCRFCGSCKQREGLPQSPCSGPCRIVLRESEVAYWDSDHEHT